MANDNIFLVAIVGIVAIFGFLAIGGSPEYAASPSVGQAVGIDRLVSSDSALQASSAVSARIASEAEIVRPKASTCEDPDGADPYVAGQTTDRAAENQFGAAFYFDSCSVSTNNGDDVATEYYCDGNEVKSFEFICQQGCGATACNPIQNQPTNSPDLVLDNLRVISSEAPTTDRPYYVVTYGGDIINRGGTALFDENTPLHEKILYVRSNDDYSGSSGWNEVDRLVGGINFEPGQIFPFQSIVHAYGDQMTVFIEVNSDVRCNVDSAQPCIYQASEANYDNNRKQLVFTHDDRRRVQTLFADE